MGLYESFKTSPRLETEGIWLDLDHSRILITRAGGKNSQVIAEAEKIARTHKRALDLMGEGQAKKLFHKVYSEIIVIDWLTKDSEGSLDENGAPCQEGHEGDRYTRGISGPGSQIMEFNRENVTKTFDDLPDLFRIIKDTAEDGSLFRQELLKGIEGN